MVDDMSYNRLYYLPIISKKKRLVMQKEKTYFDGILIGFVITTLAYSILLGLVIKMITT
jgi:tetrahydromethanopterin S-methyltransferase subunit F